MDKTCFNKRFNSLVSKLDKASANKIMPLLSHSYTQNQGVQGYRPNFIAKVFDAIAVEQTAETVLRGKKILLIGTILHNWDELANLYTLGELNKSSIATEYQDYLARIYKATDINDQLSLYTVDIFWKELAIARLQFFPIKSGVVEFYSGFGFRQGLSSNLLQSIAFTSFILKYGRKPYYRTHLHTPTLDSFSPQGWIKSYLQIADMLKMDKKIRGLIRTSWYFDPKIKSISPHLSYLQDLPLQHGAQLFCVGVDDSGCALHKSKSRLALYNQGGYIPTNYLLIWPRAEIISWSNKYREICE